MEFSQSTKNIFKALADFRKVMVQPKKEASNPQFRSKYVPLELVTDAIDKVAPGHGLAHFQNVATQDEYMVGVQTVITHESGEHITFDWLWLDARPIVKGGGKGVATTQSQGSAITYGRRYSLSSAFGIASEVDDDGNAASGNEPQRNNNQTNNNQPKQWQRQQTPHLDGQEKQPTFNEWVNSSYDELMQLTGWGKEEITVMLEGKAGSSLKGLERERVVAVIKESIAEIKKSSVMKKASGGDWID